MLDTLTPPRRRGVEYLDSPGVDYALRVLCHRDIAISNALFGGTRALLSELTRILPRLPANATLMDIGTGTGEATALAARLCRQHGIRLQTIGLDNDAGLVGHCRRYAHFGVCGTALALPLRDHSIDIVTCSQVLHHFHGDDLVTLIREMHRVARHRVIVNDLRRSWFAVAGLWLASYPLRFHSVSRHDGIVSILRGFTTGELRALVRESVGLDALVRRWAGFRVTASWSPGPDPGGGMTS